MNRGIDYSEPGATCNRDAETGIRFGIIPVREICQAFYDTATPAPVEPNCPECGGSVEEYDDEKHGEFAEGSHFGRHHFLDYACERCEKSWSNDACYPEEISGHIIDDGEYAAFDDDSSDVWFTRSPYYTRAQFCSPCAPGACYLLNECPEGEKAYCPGHDFFDGGKAPYRVFRVSDDSEIMPEA